MSFTPTTTPDFPRHTFVLKVNDRPGAMELIAATFAHRGVSLHALLGNDATMGADELATVIVTFSASASKKEALRGALSRLSRVVALRESSGDEETLRKAVLIRLVAGETIPNNGNFVPNGCIISQISVDATTNEATCAILGPPTSVDVLLEGLRAAKSLSAVTQTVLAL